MRPFERDPMSYLMNRKRRVYSMLRDGFKSQHGDIERLCALIELDAINQERAAR